MAWRMVLAQAGAAPPRAHRWHTAHRLLPPRYWLAVGANPSDRVTFLLSRAGLIPRPPMPPRFPKPPAADKK